MTSPFAALHDPLLVLPNAWDAASGAMLAAAGFPAVGTTSLGVAAAAGVPDAGPEALEATARLARVLTALPCRVSVDLGGGFAGVEDFVAELGVDGINLEDGRGDRLADAGEQCAQIAAIKARTPAVFVNARTDTHWLGLAREETVDRLRAYVAAGADGVFVPGLPAGEIAAVAAAVDVPLNVLAAPGGPSPAGLAARGARRVSTGSLLYRAALAEGVRLAQEIGAARDVVPARDVPGYAEVDALAR